MLFCDWRAWKAVSTKLLPGKVWNGCFLLLKRRRSRLHTSCSNRGSVELRCLTMVASGGLQHTVQTAQHGEGEDDFALLRLLVVATKQVGDGPEEGGEIGISHAGKGDIQAAALRLARHCHRGWEGPMESVAGLSGV